MKLTATYTFAAPREKVFAALIDPAIIQRCIDGCEKLVKTSEDTYDAHLKIGVAGLKGSYVGKVQLKDKKPPESFTLIMEGKGAPGFVKGTAHIKLTAKGNETELHCDADAQVGGLIAAVGSRLIEATAKKMMDEFFRKFGELLASSA
jgi:carbon monoxide dehydrogenase subunit G